MGIETQKQQSSVAEAVEQLVAVNPYNPDILPDLENYVNEQVLLRQKNKIISTFFFVYYSHARLFFEPERLSTQIVARILVKALMAMPAPDFSLCLFLIPERVTARFRQFWDEAAKSRHIVEAVPGFEHAIQAYALHVLSLSYQKVPRSVLAEAINIEGLSLDKFLEHQATNSGWILEKGQGRGQLIILPQNEFNHPELKKSTADSIPLDHITRIFPILS
ncbi:hypothetical protein RHSIM_Rhsim05G0002100 [Rhododendron simsii]|uniref:CSN8/PSMD8/EIF3K domain-containing protein n=1 Tax=Rhododendron simsii TaxID=118357 RepID=A0A834LQ62_RHOSS|nr:hypothetical protein RHSIM_Rhsim05G0002100 [Rhododendron simsii]